MDENSLGWSSLSQVIHYYSHMNKLLNITWMLQNAALQIVTLLGPNNWYVSVTADFVPILKETIGYIMTHHMHKYF